LQSVAPRCIARRESDLSLRAHQLARRVGALGL
jgi:hypothetical protein